jgi:hypothetical protein
MTLRYADGNTLEAVLIKRMGDRIRAVIKDSDDVVELTKISGTWVSEDCEPVHLTFAWQALQRPELVNEEDCICPPELAAHLIHLLHMPESEDESPSGAVTLSQLEEAAFGAHVV